MQIKKFKNGNINVKGYADTIESCESYNDFIAILCNSIQLDFSYAGEVATNVFGAYELYNTNTDKMYLVTYDNYVSFVSGEIVRLYGYRYDKMDYENTDIFEYLK